MKVGRRIPGRLLLALFVPAAAHAERACAETKKGIEVKREWSFDGERVDSPWRNTRGRWKVRGGKLVHADRWFSGGVATQPDLVLADGSIEADLRIEEVYWDRESVWVGLALRVPGASVHAYDRGGYLAFLRADGEAVLLRSPGETLAAKRTDLRPRERSVRFRLEIEGKRIRVSADGSEIFDVEDDTISRGEVVLANYGNTASFDDVVLRGTIAAPLPPERVEAVQPIPVDREPVKPLPRIGVRRGRGRLGKFVVAETGEGFVPAGFNHTVLDGGWHATFNVGVYDPGAMEKTLAEMRRLGANTIRVWAWGTPTENGFCGGPAGLGLNGEYMENFVDFLRRANRHGMYVVPILDEVPRNRYYDAVDDRVSAGVRGSRVTGTNRRYLAPGPLASKRAAARDFVAYVRAADPNLLSTVLGWSLANEICVRFDEGPFVDMQGVTTIFGPKAYDMSVPEERRACYDEGIRHWAAELAAAIHEVDPDALVTAGMWTADAHGRPAAHGLLPDEKDPRIPPRPSVLADPGCGLDFLDIHVYPWDGTGRILREAHEWDSLRAAGAIVLMGEYGVFKDKDLEEAKTVLNDILANAFAADYRGALFWVWDLPGRSWTAQDDRIAEYVMEQTRRIASGESAPNSGEDAGNRPGR